MKIPIILLTLFLIGSSTQLNAKSNKEIKKELKKYGYIKYGETYGGEELYCKTKNGYSCTTSSIYKFNDLKNMKKENLK